MIAPARAAAYDILQRVGSGRSDLPSAVARARESLTDERDRALATDIATGTERWRAALDHLIVHFARRPVSRLDAEVVTILRLSLYQLLHLTRVPASAVVDDAVSLTRKAGKKSASGFVNAVLRTCSRQRPQLPWPPRPHDPADRDAALQYLSTTLSHPAWLAARWLDRLGFDRTEAWMRFNNEPATLTLRANRLRTTRENLLARLHEAEVDAEPTRYAPDGLLVRRGRVGEAGDEASFVVQDEASQLVALLAGPAPGPLVLDTCASPGGKATAIAATLPDNGRLVACDVRERRMRLLRRTVEACGAAQVRLVQADITRPLPFHTQFSTVIVDAPCSGLGTIRRDPDIRWHRQEQDLPALAAAQRAMLEHAAGVVAPGGRLVYATCSTEPEENEQVADWFLQARPDFTPLPAQQAHPAIAPDLVDERGHLRTEPDRHGLEGFFGAVFERARQL